MLARIKKLEEELKAKADDGSNSYASMPERKSVDLTKEESMSPEPGTVGGQMINEMGHSRYVEKYIFPMQQTQFRRSRLTLCTVRCGRA